MLADVSVVCRWCVGGVSTDALADASVGSDSLPLPKYLILKQVAQKPFWENINPTVHVGLHVCGTSLIDYRHFIQKRKIPILCK